MDNILVNKDRGFAAEDVFKVTALLYFREALERQQFEECKGLISAAKELGVAQEEIQQVIADYLRGDKGGGGEEIAPANRIRSLKEKK